MAPKPSSILDRASGNSYSSEELLAAISEEGGMPEGEIVDVAQCEATAGPKVDRRKFNRPVCSAGNLKPNKPYVAGGVSGDSAALWNEHDIPREFAPRYRTEKWEHRIIAFLRAQGHSGAEIAKITGYASGSIYQILQLPWVKDVIAEEIARSGREGVQTMLQVEAKENVEFLVTIRNDTKQQTRDRITAAKELLDRTYGKPNQPITHREEVDPTSLTDAEIVNLIHAGGRSN
jgi:lambda repressor-like predicted transcriptional regulator